MEPFILVSLIVLVPVILALIDQKMSMPNQNTKTQKSKKPKKPKEKSFAGEKVVDDVLYGECIEALRALGMKAMDAKIKTKLMFERKNYNKVEDFLMEVYKNE